MTILLLLALLVQWTAFTDRSRPEVILEGQWQSCREDGSYTERVYDGTGWELHLGPDDEFAIFAGVQEAHRDHALKTNLLGPSYHAADVQTWRGKRSWTVPRLKLSFNVTQAGGSQSDCTSWWVQLTRTN